MTDLFTVTFKGVVTTATPKDGRMGITLAVEGEAKGVGLAAFLPTDEKPGTLFDLEAGPFGEGSEVEVEAIYNPGGGAKYWLNATFIRVIGVKPVPSTANQWASKAIVSR